MIFYKVFFDDALKYIMLARNMKKEFQLQNFEGHAI
jgi:hypothetical protein